MALHFLIAQIRQKRSCSDKYFVFLAEIRAHFLIIKQVFKCKFYYGLFQSSKLTFSHVFSLLLRVFSLVPSLCIDQQRAEQGVCFMCHNVLNGISEPPTGRCFQRVRLEEKCGITQDMAVMHLHFQLLMADLFHVTFVCVSSPIMYLGNVWRSELVPEGVPDPISGLAFCCWVH